MATTGSGLFTEDQVLLQVDVQYIYNIIQDFVIMSMLQLFCIICTLTAWVELFFVNSLFCGGTICMLQVEN